MSLRYADLISVLPSRVRVLVWPTSQFKKDGINTPSPARLSYAEDALRTMSLPEGGLPIIKLRVFSSIEVNILVVDYFLVRSL